MNAIMMIIAKIIYKFNNIGTANSIVKTLKLVKSNIL